MQEKCMLPEGHKKINQGKLWKLIQNKTRKVVLLLAALL